MEMKIQTLSARMKFDFENHKIVYAGEVFPTAYEFFNCNLCGALWERCDRTYVAEGTIVLGRCCPDCSVALNHKGAKSEDWSAVAGNA